MAFLPGGKTTEFWALMAGALVFYLLSTVFQTENLKNILIVASAILFVIAFLRLRRP
jgi:hypothetical protein